MHVKMGIVAPAGPSPATPELRRKTGIKSCFFGDNCPINRGGSAAPPGDAKNKSSEAAHLPLNESQHDFTLATAVRRFILSPCSRG